MNKDAYRSGIKMHDNGLSYKDCPSKYSVDSRRDWEQGWRDAEHRDRLAVAKLEHRLEPFTYRLSR